MRSKQPVHTWNHHLHFTCIQHNLQKPFKGNKAQELNWFSNWEGPWRFRFHVVPQTKMNFSVPGLCPSLVDNKQRFECRDTMAWVSCIFADSPFHCRPLIPLGAVPGTLLSLKSYTSGSIWGCREKEDVRSILSVAVPALPHDPSPCLGSVHPALKTFAWKEWSFCSITLL